MKTFLNYFIKGFGILPKLIVLSAFVIVGMSLSAVNVDIINIAAELSVIVSVIISILSGIINGIFSLIDPYS